MSDDSRIRQGRKVSSLAEVPSAIEPPRDLWPQIEARIQGEAYATSFRKSLLGLPDTSDFLQTDPSPRLLSRRGRYQMPTSTNHQGRPINLRVSEIVDLLNELLKLIKTGNACLEVPEFR